MNGMESRGRFGGIQTPRDQARVVILPVAYDLTASYGTGARNGPQALLDASFHMELFDERLGFTPTDIGVHTEEIHDQIATGPAAMVDAVAGAVGGVLDEGRMPVLLGGDHSLTIGALRAFAERGISLTVLQLDAHADLREEYQGTPFSHACVMARAREMFPCVQLGIRSVSAAEYSRIRSENLAVFPIRRLREDREEVAREAQALLGSTVYMTIDLDVLDPSIMPATGTPEPGGLRWDELLWFVRSLTRGRRVVGFDLVELAPIPGLHAPDFLAAKLVNKVLGYTIPPDG
ncbi:MAG: agmatinase [Candidatus Eisenbacteria bacterium]|nr:agmatinase [Candidatus Latescibacterota bacterium]MBD3302059.1 agmatinase [Candidatus Eisenbacteria bacterium]